MRQILVLIALILVGTSAALITLAGYAQHIITCIKNEAIGMLVVGMLVAPLAVLHGFGIWLGLFAR